MAEKPENKEAFATGRVLVVDDEMTALRNMRRILEKEGCKVATDSNPVHALERLKTESFDVVVSDLKMPHMDGMELLEEARRIAPEVEVIIITGFASLDGAVEATKKGAYQFLAKPFSPDELRAKVAQALWQKKMRDQARPNSIGRHDDPSETVLIGRSPQMMRLIEVVDQIAPTDCGVLIYGESGTGKELVAQAIHEQSGRSGGPWVAFNCAAFNQELMENELFGHEKGAYTGAHETKVGLLEKANGGTIFFDEIGEMPMTMQVKLLRALQEREVLRVGGTQPVPVDLRVVAATARNLLEEVQSGRFRQDLYYRINVVQLEVPRLAERGEDIPLLAYHFLERFQRRMDKKIRGISHEALQLLISYPFPGNVRELMNIMERAAALCRDNVIHTRDLPPDLASVELSSFSRPDDEIPTLEQLERDYIEHVLKRAGGVRTKAADMLGIDRVSLWRKMKKYNL